MDFIPLSDLIGGAAILAVGLFSLAALTITAFFPKARTAVFVTALLGAAAGIVFAGYSFPDNQTAFSDMLLVGGFANFYSILFLVIAVLTMVLSAPYMEKEGYRHSEFYVLVLFAAIGMMMMGASGDLITMFLGLEVMSVTFYVMAGLFRAKLTSNESSLKYFLLGAFATGFLLYGIALIYGTTGTTNLIRIAAQFPQAFDQPLHVIGWGLLLIGLAFKVGAFPFHMWVPDVYEGAPTSVTAFMSTGGKAAAFSAFILVFSIPMAMHDPRMTTVLAVLAAGSMIVGNWFGLSQTNLKRMLAYSSIAHAGYMLIGIAAASPVGQQGITFYLVSYALTNLGAFGVVMMLETEKGEGVTYEEYAGLGRRKPVLAALLSMFMFSLTGIPPFAGFVGKYYLFASAVQSGLTWLAVLGVITSLISNYYYLRVVVYMYFRDGSAEEPSLPASSLAAVALSAAGILVLGIMPSLIFDVIVSMF